MINPGGAPSHESGGVSHQGGDGAKESSAASIIYENAEAKAVWQIPDSPTMTAESTAVTRESLGMQPSPGLWERGLDRYPVEKASI